MKLEDQLKIIDSEINDNNLTGQRRRYLLSYRNELIEYSKSNPQITELPSQFELFCHRNPGAPECIKYDV